jgi:uncharacterized membrane protein
VAVCGSERGSVWQCTRQCVAVRLIVYVSACGSVRLRDRAAVCSSAAVVCSSAAAVCGCAAGRACMAVRLCAAVRQCVAVRAALWGSVWQCVAVRVALCGSSALYVYVYTKFLTVYILYCCTLYKNKNKQTKMASPPTPWGNSTSTWSVTKINQSKIKRT